MNNIESSSKKVDFVDFFAKIQSKDFRNMMINFGSLVQIGIRDNLLKLCEKEISFDPIEKKNIFFLSFFLA